MKTKRILAATLAAASTLSFPIGVGYTLTHGPVAFLAGIVAFCALAITATLIDPTI